MSEIPELFLRIRARHGHYCSMSTLGGRLGQAAMRALSGEGADLTARYLVETCAVDGVAVATGCLPEERRLSVCSAGSHCLELWDRAAGSGVRAELTEAALARAADCRRLQDEGAETAAASALAALRNAPEEELVRLTPLVQRGDTQAESVGVCSSGGSTVAEPTVR